MKSSYTDCLLYLQSLLRRFVKRELLQDLTPLQLTKVDVADEANWVPVMNADIGLGAESAIKVILIYCLCRNECMNFCAVCLSNQIV